MRYGLGQAEQYYVAEFICFEATYFGPEDAELHNIIHKLATSQVRQSGFELCQASG